MSALMSKRLMATPVFSPCELQHVVANSGSRQRDLFLRYWTLKEAYIKAVGAGLRLPLRSISFCLTEDEEPRIAFDDNISDTPMRWRFWQPGAI
jgi:4'-phosphopantetheinyl transferase